MSSDLTAFISYSKKMSEARIAFGDMPLTVALYISIDPAPEQLVSSVRAVVFKGGSVLVVEDRPGHYMITPGGQCERGESQIDTLRRELLEETGWSVKDILPLGFIHFHHLGPKPDGYKYQYPDFIWSIYTAESDEFIRHSMIKDDYVINSSFRFIDENLQLGLDPDQLELLKAALAQRKLI